jgi:hypothetical protein
MEKLKAEAEKSRGAVGTLPDSDARSGGLKKRPVMFRVMDDNVWKVFSDEKEAADYADKIGMSYQGLYVRDGM